MILIVDDLPANVYSLKKVLESNGFEVDTALSGEEALKKVLANAYVLVILDVQMPDMDGFEVAAHMHGLERTKNTAIIFLSANAINTKLITKGYQSGAADYIVKPVDPDILMLRVKTLYALYEARIKNSRQQQEINALYLREKTLNESLAASAQKLIAAQRLAKMGNWEYRSGKQALVCSPEVYPLLGVPAGTRIDLSYVLRHMPLEERDLVINFWSKVKNQHTFEFIHRYITENGDVKYLKQYGKVMRTRGVPSKIVGIVQDVTSQKAQEAEILEAYQRYELVNLATNDLLWDWDIETGLVQCNANISRIYGYSDEAIGESVDWWQNLIHPADTQRLFSTFVETARLKNRNCSCEYRMRTADGDYRDVYNQSYCLYDTDGNLQRLICAVKDVSELKKTEKDLIDTEHKLIQTIESIQEGFFTCNRQWEITYWNKLAAEMLGVSKADALGKNLWELFPEAKTTKFFEQYTMCLVEQRPYSFEEYFFPKDAWYRVNVHPSGDGIAVYFEDITQELMKGLELNNARIQAEIHSKTTRDIIWDWDLRSGTVTVNRNFNVQFQYPQSQKEFTIDWWKSRIFTADRLNVEQSIADALARDYDTWEMEYRFCDARNRYHFVRDRAIFFRDENGQPFRITGSMSDIQELKEIEGRLSEIAFSNSHVIRKPLANILGLVELLKLEPEKPDPEIIELIKQCGEELDDVIKKIGTMASTRIKVS